MKFTVRIDRDEDGVWIAECHAIPGCVSQGGTQEEALQKISEAITLCLAVWAEQGLPVTIETRQGGGHRPSLARPRPVLAASEVLAELEALGWQATRRGASHIILTKPGRPGMLSVPVHDLVARGTYRSLVRARSHG